MTRINCIDPELLIDKHLGAEYYELPRIFGLVRKAIERGEKPGDKRNPTEYTLGSGHCRFFYPKLGFLKNRYESIVEECRRRGRKVSYGDSSTLVEGIPEEWLGDWEPDDKAVSINVARIEQRGGLRRV